eukprot:CAMPEP_0206146104 /NCGR_PEP_ID=MMETSP1473-20131121/29439_1 /ASSEMBLY_ACC=CAM_ASM_001109 /TAXON_ID=1461547 /ORGANISM="Stichococcus sp, Strain RCC1054" /LENGTH=124 /DNA_ID=CAMNT_0053542551 /DNA_START=235 /DNA_END=607 /DNA_ORIENTATION=+
MPEGPEAESAAQQLQSCAQGRSESTVLDATPSLQQQRGAFIALPEICSDAPQPSIAGSSLEGLSENGKLRTHDHRSADYETSAIVAAVPPQHPVLAVMSAGAVAIPAGETVTELFARLLGYSVL